MLDKNIRSSMHPIPITACSTINACGIGTDALHQGLLSGKHALRPPRLVDIAFQTVAGEVKEDLPNIDPSIPHFASRNARIALAALNHAPDGLLTAVQTASARYGAHRIGVVIGTSTSGIYETENAYKSLEDSGHAPDAYSFPHQHAWVATAHFLKHQLALKGPCYAVSTACSSSSKTIACAQRLINSGVCDAVLTGGVDALCRLTLQGFKSLELVAEQPCTPLDENRCGINLGEGAGLLLLEKSAPEFSHCVHLLGTGESSDAHHMTAPHPEGKGAASAMGAALKQATLSSAKIDYVNLHATGTLKNDASEMRAMEAVFDPTIQCSGTKGLTGHTLGAAGGIEAIISWLALTHRFKPGTCSLKNLDESFKCDVLKDALPDQPLQFAMSNNFGFGGNNTSIILGWKHA